MQRNLGNSHQILIQYLRKDPPKPTLLYITSELGCAIALENYTEHFKKTKPSTLFQRGQTPR
jgi:hypothetical protein